jgi:hypothetical protein
MSQETLDPPCKDLTKDDETPKISNPEISIVTGEELAAESDSVETEVKGAKAIFVSPDGRVVKSSKDPDEEHIPGAKSLPVPGSANLLTRLRVVESVDLWGVPRSARAVPSSFRPPNGRRT